MADETAPQIYLITPPEIELGSFPALLGSVLDAHPVACVRLALSSKNEDRVARAADALRDEIRDTKCTCTWECAQADNVLFHPRNWARLALGTAGASRAGAPPPGPAARP